MSKRSRYDEDELYVEIEDPLSLDYEEGDTQCWANCEACGCAKLLNDFSYVDIYDTEDDSQFIFGGVHLICSECVERLELSYIEKASPECILCMVSHEWRSGAGRDRYRERLSNL